MPAVRFRRALLRWQTAALIAAPAAWRKLAALKPFAAAAKLGAAHERLVEAQKAASALLRGPSSDLRAAAAAKGLSLAALRSAPAAEARAALCRSEEEDFSAALDVVKQRVAGELQELAAKAADVDRRQAYVSLLHRAVSNVGGNSVLNVAQTGFQVLHDIAEGRPLPSCPICHSEVSDPVVAPCVHVSCSECLVTWLNASRGPGPGHRTGSAPCPLCRKPFSKRDLIRVALPSSAPDDAVGAAGPAVAGPAVAGPADEPPPSVPYRGPPRFTPAATDADVAAAAAAASGLPLARGDGRHPSIPSLYLSHLYAARAQPVSAKLQALLSDLLPLLASDPSAKAVVFSQSTNSVAHVAALLRDQGIDCVRIQPVMGEAERGEAVERFNSDAAVRVFVLHVGAAAAGLTLTKANTVFLLEPLLNASDEAQAVNRCHRIGQERPVSTIQYYTERTIEERLLAYRSREAPDAPAAPAAAAAAAAGPRPRKRKATPAEDEDSDVEMGEAAPSAGGGANEAEAGLASLASDKLGVRDGAKLRFLFGLPSVEPGEPVGGAAAAEEGEEDEEEEE
jgi:hypothetical protein